MLIVLFSFSFAFLSCTKPKTRPVDGSQTTLNENPEPGRVTPRPEGPDGGPPVGAWENAGSGNDGGDGGMPSVGAGGGAPGGGTGRGGMPGAGEAGGSTGQASEIVPFELVDRSCELKVVDGVPKYFLAKGWLDGRSILGITGTNPIRFNLDTGDYSTLGFTAWDVRPSPDGSWVSYLKEDGVSVARVDGTSKKHLWPTRKPSAEEAAAGDADPGGGIWSPSATKLLVWYEHEWDTDFFVVDRDSGKERRLSTRRDGYFLTGPVGWLDEDRLVFTTRASVKKDGMGGYSHGYRSDLALYDLRDDSYRLITNAEDGEFIEGLSTGEHGIVFRRHWEGKKSPTVGVMDAAGSLKWEEAFGESPGYPSGHPALSPNGDLACAVRVKKSDEVNHEYHLVVHSCGGRSVVAKMLVGDHLAGPFWSPDGRQLLLSFSYGAPAEGGYQSRYATLVLRLSGST